MVSAAVPVGYYPTDSEGEVWGDAICRDCADHELKATGVAIFCDESLDYPIYCAECGGILPVSLTAEGEQMVRDWTEESTITPYMQAAFEYYNYLWEE